MGGTPPWATESPWDSVAHRGGRDPLPMSDGNFLWAKLISMLKTQKPLFSVPEEPKVAILGSEKAPAGAPPHTLFLIHRRSLERQYSEARLA